jgi:hypothetical protein
MKMTNSTWPFCRIALFVTGKGEERFLPKLFRSLQKEGNCTFQVAMRVSPLRPIRSVKRKQAMVGSGKKIDSRDENLGLVARRFLGGFHYVALIDDLEHDYGDQVCVR